MLLKGGSRGSESALARDPSQPWSARPSPVLFALIPWRPPRRPPVVPMPVPRHPTSWGRGRGGRPEALGKSALPQLPSALFLLFLCSAGPCYLPLSLTPSSSCLKFRLWTFPLGAVMCLFCVLHPPPPPAFAIAPASGAQVPRLSTNHVQYLSTQ